MRKLPIALLAPFAALPLAAAPAHAAPVKAKPAPEASIPFANYGGVWDWRSKGDSTVYFEDNHNQWYRAKLFMPAWDLPYVEFIGIDARPNGTLDRFSAIWVHGHKYPFSSFEKVSGPPSGHHGDKKGASKS